MPTVDITQAPYNGVGGGKWSFPRVNYFAYSDNTKPTPSNSPEWTKADEADALGVGTYISILNFGENQNPPADSGAQ